MATLRGTTYINPKAMVFVDGENLAIWCGSMLGSRGTDLPKRTLFRQNVYIWNPSIYRALSYENLRTFYYTSVQGDLPTVDEVKRELKNLGIQAPRVFKKAKGGRSKRVDISLATDMLTHAHRQNYDVAVLIAGDGDYVPLVEAVMSEGKRVHVMFVEDGLSPDLELAADKYTDLSELMFREF